MTYLNEIDWRAEDYAQHRKTGKPEPTFVHEDARAAWELKRQCYEHRLKAAALAALQADVRAERRELKRRIKQRERSDARYWKALDKRMEAQPAAAE